MYIHYIYTIYIHYIYTIYIYTHYDIYLSISIYIYTYIYIYMGRNCPPQSPESLEPLTPEMRYVTEFSRDHAGTQADGSSREWVDQDPGPRRMGSWEVSR